MEPKFRRGRNVSHLVSISVTSVSVGHEPRTEQVRVQAAVGGLKVAGGRRTGWHLGAGTDVRSLAGTPRGAPFSPTIKREEDATNP
jgi:hypothetical protein